MRSTSGFLGDLNPTPPHTRRPYEDQDQTDRQADREPPPPPRNWAADRKLTPTQIRARLVTALKSLGYTTSDLCHEQGRAKAWLRKPAGRAPRGKAAAAKVAAAIKKAGLSATPASTKGWSGEWDVTGPQYRVTINQESDTGNGGGAFVEVRKREVCLDSLLEYEDAIAYGMQFA